MTRTPEERERMYALLNDVLFADRGVPWSDLGDNLRREWGKTYDTLLAKLPSMWNDLPPNPAEAARKEAEEDGRLLAGIQKDYATWEKNGRNRKYYPMWLGDALDIIGRMSARAAAGYPVLIAPKGE